MIDLRAAMGQIFTPGTVPCTLFGIALGAVFAILCLTIGPGPAILIAVFCLIGGFVGGVRDKKAFVRNLFDLFHRNDSDY